MSYITVKIPPEPPSSATTIAAKIMEQYGLSCGQIRSEHLQANLPFLNKIFPNTTEQPVGDAFKGLPTDPEPAPEPTWAVMIETRAHPALESVLSNVSRCCGIPIQLFHSKDNREFVRKGEIAHMVDQGRVTLTELNISGEIGLGFYNQLLLSPRFWELCRGRGKILVCQTDSICCSGSAYSLADFKDIDYIGSRWSRRRPVGLIIDGGSGGLSLRNWQASMDCLRRFPPARWPAGEDGYFGFHLDLMGARVGTMEEAGQFSTQDVFTHNSFGCHQVSRLQDLDLSAFLAYCPEARSVFPHCEKRLTRPNPRNPTTDMVLTPTAINQTTSGRSMFLSHTYEFIFFEVPRTGSNSATRALNQLDPDSPTALARKSQGSGWSFHHLTDAAKDYPHYRMLAAHRNPYDRIWSFWKQRKRGGNPEVFRSISWPRYIDWVYDPDSVPEITGAMLDIPIAEMLNLDSVDLWLDFHHLKESWVSACKALELPIIPLDTVNTSPDHGEMHMAYNLSMAERIAERFAADFAYFGYSVDSWKPGESLESAP